MTTRKDRHATGDPPTVPAARRSAASRWRPRRPGPRGRATDCPSRGSPPGGHLHPPPRTRRPSRRARGTGASECSDRNSCVSLARARVEAVDFGRGPNSVVCDGITDVGRRGCPSRGLPPGGRVHLSQSIGLQRPLPAPRRPCPRPTVRLPGRGSPPGESIIPAAFGEPPRCGDLHAVPAADGRRRVPSVLVVVRPVGADRGRAGRGSSEPRTDRGVTEAALYSAIDG